jgi:hypothetical protein
MSNQLVHYENTISSDQRVSSDLLTPILDYFVETNSESRFLGESGVPLGFR